jgi:hypothetical protein
MKIETITVRWPSGQIDKIGPEAADQQLVIQEGRGVTERHPGSKQ